MNTSPIKIQQGMKRQLSLWRGTVASHQQRLGWKIGFNMSADQQRMGLPSAMVGFLSGERRHVTGGCYQPSADSTLLIEPEVALLIGADVPAGARADQAIAAIEAYSAALELVDTTRSVDNDIEEILAGNLFHEGVVIAEQRLPPGGYHRQQLNLSLSINNVEVRTLEQPRVPDDFATIIITVANTLAAHGEQLQRGDWIITGAAAKPVPVQVGDEINLEMGELGSARLSIK
jgi:2-keto-4-pentenoate hydratase